MAEDKNAAATVTVDEAAQADQPAQSNPEPAERMDGAFLSIICSATIPCGLILMIGGALIGVILGTQINRNEGFPELHLAANSTLSNVGGTLATRLNTLKKTGGHHAFFIDFNPSSLTAIATLTGKVIPYLSSSIMALVAFFAARRLVLNSKSANSEQLLSPHQLSILIELLGGSTYTPLTNCVKHHVKNKQRWIKPLPVAFTALATVTALGIIIPVIDTWFSITVTPVTVDTVKKSNFTSTFGRAINTKGCTDYLATGDNICSNARTPCNLGCFEADNSLWSYSLNGVNSSVEALVSTSRTNQASSYRDPSTGKMYYYVNDATIPSAPYARDFRTTTLAVQTKCKPMTTSCSLAEPSPVAFPVWINTNYSFKCTEGFKGSLLSNGATSLANYNTSAKLGNAMTGIAFSPDAQLSSRTDNAEFASFQNPLYFGAWSVGWQVAPSDDESDYLWWDNDPEIYYDDYWNYVWMLHCESALYEAVYSYVNGSITEWNVTLSPPGTGGMLSVPFVSGLPQGSLALQLAASNVYNVSSSSQLADQWGDEFSRYSISILTGALESRNNSIEQIRNNNHSATRVPMIPLFLLLGFKLLYGFAVLALAIAAWHYTDPRETQSVKERLTVKGLTAAYFAEGATHQQVAVKNVEQLFSKSASTDAAPGDAEAAREIVPETKVAIQPTEAGGWQFVKVAAGTVWTHVQPIVVGEVMAQANAGQFGTDGKDAAMWAGLVTK